MHNEENTPDKAQAKFISELNDIMFTIAQKFKPVPTTKQANTTFTTAEFTEKIKEHFPFAAVLEDSDVYALLKEKGYTYAAVGSESKLEWLVFKQ